MCGAARELTRTRTHTYAVLSGMTRRLPADRVFLYLGGWALDHIGPFLSYATHTSSTVGPCGAIGPWAHPPSTSHPSASKGPVIPPQPLRALLESVPNYPTQGFMIARNSARPKILGQHTSYVPVSAAYRIKNDYNGQIFNLIRSEQWHRISSFSPFVFIGRGTRDRNRCGYYRLCHNG